MFHCMNVHCNFIAKELHFVTIAQVQKKHPIMKQMANIIHCITVPLAFYAECILTSSLNIG